MTGSCNHDHHLLWWPAEDLHMVKPVNTPAWCVWLGWGTAHEAPPPAAFLSQVNVFVYKMKAMHLKLLYEWRYSIWSSVPHWKAELRGKRKSTPALSLPPNFSFSRSVCQQGEDQRETSGA